MSTRTNANWVVTFAINSWLQKRGDKIHFSWYQTIHGQADLFEQRLPLVILTCKDRDALFKKYEDNLDGMVRKVLENNGIDMSKPSTAYNEVIKDLDDIFATHPLNRAKRRAEAEQEGRSE